MPDLTLVVLAAGLSSRYGGTPKQTDGMGPQGETLLDYAVFDALRAGFNRVVFVIRREAEAGFRQRVTDRLAPHVAVDLAFQDIADLPEGFAPPAGRVKPWGACHALLAARHQLDGPFGVINADDVYGRSSYRLLAARLSAGQAGCLIGFPLAATLSAHGTVSRGVCVLSSEGHLAGITEMTRIGEVEGRIVNTDPDGTEQSLAATATVSMNMWGFQAPVLDGLWRGFGAFLAENRDNLTAEFTIPDGVDRLIRAGEIALPVDQSADQWFGVTYPDDKPLVQAMLARLVAEGVYPAPLWG